MTMTGHKHHQRRTIYTGPGLIRGGIKAEVSGPAGHLDPFRKGIGSGRCVVCSSFFVRYESDPDRTKCYRCPCAGWL